MEQYVSWSREKLNLWNCKHRWWKETWWLISPEWPTISPHRREQMGRKEGIVTTFCVTVTAVPAFPS